MAAKDSTGVLIEQMNALNLPPKVWTEVNLALDAPVAAGGDDPKLTRLLVRSVPGRGYYNDVEITYNRVDLTEVLNGSNIRSINDFTVDSIVSLINSMYGLVLTADDLVPFTPPSLAEDASQTITIQATNESRGFFGSVDITLTHARTPLDVIVALKNLSVRNHPLNPSVGVLSARMLTWGRDFTSLRDAIKVSTVDQSYSDWETLQAAAQYLGIPAWTKGTIRDVATSSVPDANPAFARVVIQDNVQSAGMVGSIYMHYNILEGA